MVALDHHRAKLLRRTAVDVKRVIPAAVVDVIAVVAILSGAVCRHRADLTAQRCIRRSVSAEDARRILDTLVALRGVDQRQAATVQNVECCRLKVSRITGLVTAPGTTPLGATTSAGRCRSRTQGVRQMPLQTPTRRNLRGRNLTPMLPDRRRRRVGIPARPHRRWPLVSFCRNPSMPGHPSSRVRADVKARKHRTRAPGCGRVRHPTPRQEPDRWRQAAHRRPDECGQDFAAAETRLHVARTGNRGCRGRGHTCRALPQPTRSTIMPISRRSRRPARRLRSGCATTWHGPPESFALAVRNHESTSPLKRVNREVKWRADVIGDNEIRNPGSLKPSSTSF